jgi:hypothetical protein
MMNSLRDVGYSFASAVADIVDNSIEAEATKIDIKLEFFGDDSWVRIVDNGRGMSPEQIIEAMRYGSEREYTKKEDLGKFGLGLKTASLSQCRFLAVASKNSLRKNKIKAYCWDLDHVERTNKWQILPLMGKPWKSIVCDPLEKNIGTVVLWRQLDRLLGYRHPYGEFARIAINKMCRELENHLAMVFHRFISGELLNKKKVEITVNGVPIVPWDPFVKEEKKTRLFKSIYLDVEYEGIRDKIHIQPYVLPSQQEFSSNDAFKKAAGPAGWNQQQGFYIYRADRLIQSGGWCRLRTPDEHLKLSRIAINFSPILDDAFQINVAKMRVQLPQGCREAINDAIQPAIKIAQNVYRGANSRVSSGGLLRSTIQSPPVNINRSKSVSNEAQQFWTLDELENKIMNIAKSSEKLVVKNIFNRLRKKLEAE